MKKVQVVMRKMCVILIVLVPLGALALAPNWGNVNALGRAPADTLKVGPDFKMKSLAGHFVLIEDVEPGEEIEGIVSGGGHREVGLKGNPALGYRTDDVWLKIQLERTGDLGRSLFVWVQPSVLDHVRVYLVETQDNGAQQITKIGSIGDNDPADQWNGVGAFLIFEYEEPNADEYELYFKINSTSSILLSGYIGVVESFNRNIYMSDIFSGILISLFLTVSIIFLFIFIRSKSVKTLSFSLFSLMYGINTIVPSRVHEIYIENIDRKLLDLVNVQSLILLHLAGVWFFRQYLELWRTNKGLDAASLGLCGILFGMLIGTGFGFQQIIMPVELVLVGLALCVYFGEYFRQFLAGRKVGRAGLLGTGLYSVAVLVYHLILIGILAPDGPSLSRIYLSNAIFILIFTSGLLEEALLKERRDRLSVKLKLARSAERNAVELAREMTRELEEAKVAAEKALAVEKRARAEQLRFVDVISHQLLTPVAVIKSSVASLRKTLSGENRENRTRLQRIDDALHRLSETIDVSLVGSRIDAVDGIAKKRNVALLPTLREIVERSGKLFPNRDVALRFEGLSEATRVNIDVEMLGIAAGNLIDNALKFSDRGSPVSIEARRDGDDLTLEIRDRGIGIPVNEIAKVKERYFRGSNAGSYFGTGLGLDIVHEVAFAHGGRLELENAEGGGVIARLTIVAEFEAD